MGNLVFLQGPLMIGFNFPKSIVQKYLSCVLPLQKFFCQVFYVVFEGQKDERWIEMLQHVLHLVPVMVGIFYEVLTRSYT